jgi:Uma2 family endonuclease
MDGTDLEGVAHTAILRNSKAIAEPAVATARDSEDSVGMATQPVFDKPVTVEEYLSTVCEHDCEYVDGVVEERDMGEIEHSWLQAVLIGIFLRNMEDWKIFPLPEQRVQTGQRNFRVPDLAILRADAPRRRILARPPPIAVEIQSPEDTLRRTANKAAEYLEFGIEHVWVVDPYARVAYRGTANGLELVRGGELTVPGTPIRIALEDLLAELDRV